MLIAFETNSATIHAVENTFEELESFMNDIGGEINDDLDIYEIDLDKVLAYKLGLSDDDLDDDDINFNVTTWWADDTASLRYFIEHDLAELA